MMDYSKIYDMGAGAFRAYAPAKLNITLEIGETDSASGLHKISSIMQAISLHDTITMRLGTVSRSIEGFVVNDNLVERAMSALEDKIGRKLPCGIRVDKCIPIAAGMGGGSSDAAAALRLANVAFDLGLKINELEQVARSVGNDISFLLHGGRAKVEGSLEHRISSIDVPEMYYLIAHPDMELSTKQMYSLYDKTGSSFTELAAGMCADTRRLLDNLRKTNPAECAVTGKGPTVFAGYSSRQQRDGALGSIAWFSGELFSEHAIGALEHS